MTQWRRQAPTAVRGEGTGAETWPSDGTAFQALDLTQVVRNVPESARYSIEMVTVSFRCWLLHHPW